MDEKKIICLAVDDEPPALQVMQKYIAMIPALTLQAAVPNAIEALSVLQQHRVDLMFLDIQMPHLMGTDLIRALVNPPRVIFTTAFRKYAADGFDLDAVDYLVKPISFERFLKAVNKVMRLNLVAAGFDRLISTGRPQTAPADEYIYLRADRKNMKILLGDILFIESLKDYVKVTTTERTFMSKQAITSLEDCLPRHDFVRIHRSFIVSVKKIDGYSNALIQIGRFELPISRSYRHEVEKLLHRKR